MEEAVSGTSVTAEEDAGEDDAPAVKQYSPPLTPGPPPVASIPLGSGGFGLFDVAPFTPPATLTGTFEVTYAYDTNEPNSPVRSDDHFEGNLAIVEGDFTVDRYGAWTPNNPYSNRAAVCLDGYDPNRPYYNTSWPVGTRAEHVVLTFLNYDTTTKLVWYYAQLSMNAPQYQRLGMYVALSWGGAIELQKLSASPAMTDGNACYSLAGATYGLYESQLDAANDTKRIHTFTTNSSGYGGKAEDLWFSTYYIKELTASPGYELDGRIYAVALNTALVKQEVLEIPKADPVIMVVQKLDTETGEAYGKDDPSGASLAGAEFTIRYWAGYYDTVEDAEESGAPTRTWVLVTESSGQTAMIPRLLVSGDPFYYGLDGNPTLPLGTVIIQETKAPPAYLLPTTTPTLANKGIQHIKEDPLGKVIELNPLLVPETPRKLIVAKRDRDTQALLPGATFALYKESAKGAGDWKLIATKTTDATGTISYAPIAAGSYKAVETAAPAGYLLPSQNGGSNEQAFVIRESDTKQTVELTFNDAEITGAIELRKQSENPALTNGNASYSLAGATYGLYGSETNAKADKNRLHTFTTNASGYGGKAVDLKYRTYYIKELKASPGYTLDEKIYTVKLNTALTTQEVLEVPKGTPVSMLVQKLDSETGQTYGKDDPTGAALAGAEFTVRYWDGYYDTVEEAEASGVPTRVWVLKTGVDGKASMGSPWLVSGDAFYYDTSGSLILPLGTVVIQETKAPLAYLLPTTTPTLVNKGIQHIKENALGTVVAFNSLKVPETPRKLIVAKRDSETQELLPGATFKLYRESAKGAGDWKLITTKTTDAAGTITYSPIAAGSYKVVETVAPAGYLLPSQCGYSDEQAFEIKESDTAQIVKLTFEDTAGTIIVNKVDSDTAEPVDNTEFTLYSYPVTLANGLITTDVSIITSDDPAWAEVDTKVTDAQGKLVFETLPFGYYKIVETRSNPLYATNEESGGTDHFIVLDKNTTSEVQLFEDDLIQLSCEIFKDTINVTSAAFRSGEDDSLGIDNTNAEMFHYDLDFRSTSSVRADEFTVIDYMESAAAGQVTLVELFTPVTWGDTDGSFNLWYQTNLTDAGTMYSHANAMSIDSTDADIPEKAQQWSSRGWRLWAAGLPTTATTHLLVADLGLSPNEYVTAVRFEFGSVEAGFTTRAAVINGLQTAKEFKDTSVDWTNPKITDDGADRTDEVDAGNPRSVTVQGVASASCAPSASELRPATYLVTCPDELIPPAVLTSSAQAFIARNSVLTDEDLDSVNTQVIGSFMPLTFSDPPTDTSTLKNYGQSGSGKRLPDMGDSTLGTLALAGALFALGLAFIAQRRLDKSANRRTTQSQGEAA
jgi:hypothetical protein